MEGSVRERRNAVMRSVYWLRAKARCRTHRLSCFLDQPPLELLPRAARPVAAGGPGAASLVVSAGYRYQGGPEPPEEIGRRGGPRDGLLAEQPVAWLQEPGRDLWTPFWAPAGWAEVLRSLRPGSPAPPELSPEIRDALARAGILVAPEAGDARRLAWAATCDAAGRQFRTARYAIVRGLLHPLHVAAMRRYYRALLADARLPLGDPQVAERYRLHSEPVGSFWLPQLGGVMARLAGEPVTPTYVYFAAYQPGSVLPPHQDREQCEFSISLLVDYEPDPAGASGWPLFLQDPAAPDAVTAADLGPGDAVFYRGRELVHYRTALPAGHRSTSLFFHYVRPDFAGDLF
jgi:hypothetical protein